MIADNDNHISTINAAEFDGDLRGRRIVVDVENHADWFEKISKGSGLHVRQTFEVAAVQRFGEALFLNFVNPHREPHHRRGQFDGCGEAYRFQVVLK